MQTLWQDLRYARRMLSKHPIVALVMGRAFLNETITSLAVAGIVTILVGVAVAIVPGGMKRQKSAAIRP